MLINKVPKYGNDIDEVDFEVMEMLDFATKEAAKYRNINGDKFVDGLVPTSANVPHGNAIWALPSGRKAREPLADGISPYMGYDLNGPTAVINSVTKLNHKLLSNGMVLDLKFTHQILSEKESFEKFKKLIKTYFNLGGMEIQFNVINNETLKKAQEKPEEYQNLVVRVSGFSNYFTSLDKTIQDEIIARTPQDLK